MSATKTGLASSADLPSILGNAEVNIATFALGRDREGGSAIALVEVDGILLDTILAEVKTLPGVKEVKALAF